MIRLELGGSVGAALQSLWVHAFCVFAGTKQPGGHSGFPRSLCCAGVQWPTNWGDASTSAVLAQTCREPGGSTRKKHVAGPVLARCVAGGWWAALTRLPEEAEPPTAIRQDAAHPSAAAAAGLAAWVVAPLVTLKCMLPLPPE